MRARQHFGCDVRVPCCRKARGTCGPCVLAQCTVKWLRSCGVYRCVLSMSSVSRRTRFYRTPVWASGRGSGGLRVRLALKVRGRRSPCGHANPEMPECCERAKNFSKGRNAFERVAAGLPGGFRRARVGPFGLRGDARDRCRSRRERIVKPATPRPVLRPLGIAQGQWCRTRRHLPGLPRTEHPPQPAGGPRRRMLGAVGSTRRRSARRRTGCVAAAPSTAYEAQDSSGSSTARNASHGRLTACRSRLMRYPDRADDRRASLFFRRGALCMLACVVQGILCA